MINIFEDSIKEIQELYMNDNKPWIIGYSGGKDSTAMLQLVYLSIYKLPKGKRIKKVYVVSSDTLVEIPTVVERVKKTIRRINKSAKKQGMPFIAAQVSPDVNASFFVNLIGRGYPSPTRVFRWCTERLKIKPISNFILDVVSKYGEVIVLLGARKQESMSRAQTLEKYKLKGTILKKHSSLSGAYVYTPIEDWSVNDVWSYLQQIHSPWGDNNKDLITLYRKAGGDECPLVVDLTTPSCGNSRFGCWVCTVVDKDKSIHGFIESGEMWLEPMAEFRDMIKEMREQREKCRVPDSSRIGGYGPFTIEARKKIFKKLIEADKEVYKTYKKHLIKSEEIWAIQKCWEYDRVNPKDIIEIYNSIYSDNNIFKKYTNIQIEQRNDDELVLLDLCDKYEIDKSFIERLVFIENDITKMRSRQGLYSRIDTELSKYIRDTL